MLKKKTHHRSKSNNNLENEYFFKPIHFHNYDNI